MIIEEKIKLKFKNVINSSAKLTKAIKECNDELINNYLNLRLKKEPEWLKISWLVVGIVKDIKLSKCQTCGKTLPYSKIKFKSKYCSKECKFKNEDYLNFLKQVDRSSK